MIARRGARRPARAACAATLLLLAGCATQPAHRTTARVVEIHSWQSRFRPEMVTVTARSPEGLIGGAAVDLHDLRCRIGDRVDGVARGVTLMIAVGTCRPPS